MKEKQRADTFVPPISSSFILPPSSFILHIERWQTVASTNDLALDLARQRDLPVPCLVLADEQTAGRGRGANQWWSKPGALTFSLILEPHPMGLAPDRWPRIALTAGLSICEVLRRLLPDVPRSLKWPNDVLLRGRKVCGILLEPAAGPPGNPARLVLGVGINVNNSLCDAPADLRLRATSLADAAGEAFILGDVLMDVLTRLEHNLRLLAADDDCLPRAWQAHCALDGQAIEVDLGPRRVCGICRSVDREGALLVDTEDGRERLFGGTVYASPYVGQS